MKPALIIQFERDLYDDEGMPYDNTITFTRAQLEELLNVPAEEVSEATEFRCKVCGVPMVESYSEGSYVSSSLETSRWERYHGIQAMRGYPRDCITYNDVFGWLEHEAEEV